MRELIGLIGLVRVFVGTFIGTMNDVTPYRLCRLCRLCRRFRMSINAINGEISESFCSDVADFILLKCV